MPFINIKTQEKLSKEKAEKVKSELGSAIEIIPGKTERWLMVSFDAQDYMYFSGSESPSAMAEVSVFGKARPEYYEKLTAEICRIINSELKIPSDRVYVKYSEIENWGWNGGNF